MGGDGGSITTRADMVKTKGYRFLRNLGGMGYVPNTQVREGDERFSRGEARDLQLSTCSLSQEPLRLPIVACRLGRLYNKEELLSRLLNKSMPPHMQHISSLKDVQQCVTEINQETHFLVCPVSRVDIRSGVKASIVWPCGCIVSDKARRAAATAAAKEGTPVSSSSSTSHQETRDHSEGTNQNATSPSLSSPSADSGRPDARPACVNCGQRYDAEEDLIPLLPEEEELEKLQEKVKKLLEAKRAAKQAKKLRTANIASNDATSSSRSSGSSTATDNNRSNDSTSSSRVNKNGSSGKSASSAPKSVGSSPSSVSTNGDHKVGNNNNNSKSEVLHPAVVAPCATSTRLQADSFKWLRKEEEEEEEKQRKRKQRDWVLSNSSVIEEIVGTKASRAVKRRGEHAAALV